jgi:hypothetical protein
MGFLRGLFGGRTSHDPVQRYVDTLSKGYYLIISCERNRNYSSATDVASSIIESSCRQATHKIFASSDAATVMGNLYSDRAVLVVGELDKEDASFVEVCANNEQNVRIFKKGKK